ncbi:hypothetical protein ACGFSG_25805 [Streptomyces sp. NPDC048512]|uniref:hypothetical protein n=1 Tax=Streptomyces sp. NPDC048512 TaxID=3365563 RepID=UPI003710AF25
MAKSRHKKPDNVRRYFKPSPESIADLTSLLSRRQPPLIGEQALTRSTLMARSGAPIRGVSAVLLTRGGQRESTLCDGGLPVHGP